MFINQILLEWKCFSSKDNFSLFPPRIFSKCFSARNGLFSSRSKTEVVDIYQLLLLFLYITREERVGRKSSSPPPPAPPPPPPPPQTPSPPPSPSPLLVLTRLRSSERHHDLGNECWICPPHSKKNMRISATRQMSTTHSCLK